MHQLTITSTTVSPTLAVAAIVALLAQAAVWVHVIRKGRSR